MENKAVICLSQRWSTCCSAKWRHEQPTQPTRGESQSCHLVRMKPGIRDNVLCDIFVYNSRKCELIYSDKTQTRGYLEEGRGLGRVTRPQGHVGEGWIPSPSPLGAGLMSNLHMSKFIKLYAWRYMFIICQLCVSEILKYMGWKFSLFLGETGRISARVPPLSG